MDLKGLIICLSLCGLFYGAIGSDDPPSSNSISNVDSEKGSEEHFEVDAEVRQETAHEPNTIDTLSPGAQKDVHQTTGGVSTSNQNTADGRVGEVELSEDTPTSVDITWKIPIFLWRPYRADAGIISPDFSSQGFKGYFIMDPKGSIIDGGAINFKSLIISHGQHIPIFLQVFLKSNDGTLNDYTAKVIFRNYFTCDVPKRDIIKKRDSLFDKGVLTVLFKLSKEGYSSINRNSEVTTSLASMYDVGDLQAHPESCLKSVVTWKFRDFFSLPEYRQLTGPLPEISPYFFFHIYLTPKGRYDEAGMTSFQLSFRYKGDVPPEILVDYPKFRCKFSLKSRENTLYNMTGEQYHIAKLGGYCSCLIPWSEIFERKDYLVPKGELTFVLEIDSESKYETFIMPETETANCDAILKGRKDELEITKDSSTSISTIGIEIEDELGEQMIPEATETETQAPTLEDVIHGRIGDLKVYRDGPSSLDITWTIPNFFTQSYQPDKGILSPDFFTLGFKGFFVMDPKGSTTTPGVLQFRSVVFRHDIRRGYINFRLFLKKADGKFVEFTVKEEFRNFYTCDIPKHKIFEEKDIMAPKGVLTVLFMLTADRDMPDISERDCNCEDEKNKLKVCDSGTLSFKKMSSDFLELYKSGQHSDVKLICGNKTFPAHKYFLSARSVAFAALFKGDIKEDKKTVADIFHITDIQCSILDLLLQYVYSGHVDKESIPSSKLQELEVAADIYGISLN